MRTVPDDETYRQNRPLQGNTCFLRSPESEVEGSRLEIFNHNVRVADRQFPRECLFGCIGHAHPAPESGTRKLEHKECTLLESPRQIGGLGREKGLERRKLYKVVEGIWDK